VEVDLSLLLQRAGGNTVMMTAGCSAGISLEVNSVTDDGSQAIVSISASASASTVSLMSSNLTATSDSTPVGFAFKCMFATPAQETDIDA
jgi:hypothetical protein